MGPYQRTPKEVARAIRYSGLGVRSAGPVGDFLDIYIYLDIYLDIHIYHPILSSSRPQKGPVFLFR